MSCLACLYPPESERADFRSNEFSNSDAQKLGRLKLLGLPAVHFRCAMPDDLIPFLVGVVVLVVYLFISAKTEMGTKLPWKK